MLTLNAAGIASSQDKPVTSVGQVTTGASVSAGVVIVHVHELKILEDYSDLSHTNVSDDVVQGSEDTMTLVNNYVDQLPVDLDKDKLKVMIKEMYVEAQDSDVVTE